MMKNKTKYRKSFFYQIITQVVNGGRISNRKGVNIPESFIKMSSLAKDITDLKLCLDLGLDYIHYHLSKKQRILLT